MSSHCLQSKSYTKTETTTVTSVINQICPKDIPNDTTCTWSGFWSMTNSLPEADFKAVSDR